MSSPRPRPDETAVTRGVRRVIAGTGGSPGSLAALRYADALARTHEAVLVPVLAWTPPGGEWAGTAGLSGYLRQEWRDMAGRRLREALLAVWGRVPAGPRVQPQLVQGPAGWVLVSVACEPGDLLVVGAGGRGALRRMAGRGVSRYCAARARCPVVLVPPPELAQQARLRRTAWNLAHRTLTADCILRDQGQAAAG
jgi:nucleotide-binding universal stress UspA family protein